MNLPSTLSSYAQSYCEDDEDYLSQQKNSTAMVNLKPKNPSPTNSSSNLSIPESTLSASAIIEQEELACNQIYKVWGMLKLNSTLLRSFQNLKPPMMDFVVVIDHSSSMAMDNKLAFVQATIQYMVSRLTEEHRFCLIEFNHEVHMVTNGLLRMTAENKSKVLTLLTNLKPEGSTNISDALFTAIELLKNRSINEQQRISSVMLFTDGLANVGLRGTAFYQKIQKMIVPQGLTLNTFGYGTDHDSKMLQNISFCSKGGVYYYVESPESIALTFGECLAGLLSTTAHNIDVRLVGQDGCRIVSFYTKFPILEKTSVKDYVVSLGSMYAGESKSILFKLSVRKMDRELAKHPLVQIFLTYTNTLTGLDQKQQLLISAPRPFNPVVRPMPLELDRHINRYTAAAAIEGAILKANSRDYNGAQKQLTDVIMSVKGSKSAHDPYCEDLVEDLLECSQGMTETTFSTGIHYAHAFSTMYYMERSTGSANLKGVMQGSDPSYTEGRQRHHGYGYLTENQRSEKIDAKQRTAAFVSDYLPMRAEVH